MKRKFSSLETESCSDRDAPRKKLKPTTEDLNEQHLKQVQCLENPEEFSKKYLNCVKFYCEDKTFVINKEILSQPIEDDETHYFSQLIKFEETGQIQVEKNEQGAILVDRPSEYLSLLFAYLTNHYDKSIFQNLLINDLKKYELMIQECRYYGLNRLADQLSQYHFGSKNTEKHFIIVENQNCQLKNDKFDTDYVQPFGVLLTDIEESVDNINKAIQWFKNHPQVKPLHGEVPSPLVAESLVPPSHYFVNKQPSHYKKLGKKIKFTDIIKYSKEYVRYYVSNMVVSPISKTNNYFEVQVKFESWMCKKNAIPNVFYLGMIPLESMNEFFKNTEDLFYIKKGSKECDKNIVKKLPLGTFTYFHNTSAISNKFRVRNGPYSSKGKDIAYSLDVVPMGDEFSFGIRFDPVKSEIEFFVNRKRLNKWLLLKNHTFTHFKYIVGIGNYTTVQINHGASYSE